MPVRLLVLIALLLAAPAAWAQPTSKPRKALKQLKKERDGAERAYIDNRVALDLLQQERRQLLAKQTKANKQLVKAQKLQPIPARQQAVRAAKQELHRIGQQLATNQLKLEPQLTALELLRLVWIKALAAYATRKLEVAYRTRPTRPDQADKLTREAMEDLKLRANLLKYVSPPPKPPKPPPFDRAFTPNERLEWLLARMKEQVGKFRQQLKDLEPMEQRQVALVKRMARLIDRGAGKDDLRKAIAREQKKLETIKGLRRQISTYEVTYLQQIKRVSDTLKSRARKKPK